MRRAVILLITLTGLSFGAGVWLDRVQHNTALHYLNHLTQVRSLIMSNDFPAAAQKQAHVSAMWQGDEGWLKFIVSHHHTRAVAEAFVKLATALEMHWADEALLALDEAVCALSDVQFSHLATLSNVL